MSYGRPELTSCDLMTAFQKPPVIVRPRVPTNGANPATFGGKVSTPPRCPPHVFDITCALAWIGCVTNVTCVTQRVTGKRCDASRAGKYPVSMAVGGVGHVYSLIFKTLITKTSVSYHSCKNRRLVSKYNFLLLLLLATFMVKYYIKVYLLIPDCYIVWGLFIND